MPNKTIKLIMKKKLGELISLDIDKITISEFNTRCQFVDNDHVKTLMVSIEEHGYIPKSAVWVNAIKGPDGDIITYRLVAGRHRYEACRQLGLKEIPGQLYYNLTDEEECELDDIDNRLDEHHKPVNFLAIAEHYKYLRDVKGWSQRQIADAKNVSRALIRFRLSIAELPEEVKELLRGGHHGAHPTERHIREILKLSSTPHQILICKEIIASKIEGDESHKKFPELKSIPPVSMTQKDIEARVEELLTIEAKGEIAPEAIEIDKNNSSVPPDVIKDAPLSSFKTATPSEAIDIPPEPEEEQTKSEQLLFDIFSEISDTRFEKARSGEFRFSVLPMWLKHTDLITNICSSGYQLLQELIAYDLRYKPEKDKFFFIKHSPKYDKCTDFLAHIAGVKSQTLHKKILPGLKKYVNYRKTDENIKFQMKWNRLYEIYQKCANEIPFDDGGLMDIPYGYTGWIRPTPFHSIYIENGVVKDTPNDTNEIIVTEKQKAKPQKKSAAPMNTPTIKTIDTSPLAEKLRELNMAEEQINFCMEQRETAENVLKYVSEMPPAEKQKIKNMAGYIYSTVRNGFKAPDKFETVKAVEDRKDRKRVIEEFAEKIRQAYDEGRVKYFNPAEGKKFQISFIPDYQNFLYKKTSTGLPLAARFDEWMDEKYFVP